MQFVVPKFIEREARLVGSLTFKQATIMGVAILISLVLKVVLSFQLFLIISFLVLSFAFALAFVKVEGLSFAQLLLSLLHFSVGKKTYVWQKKMESVSLLPHKIVHPKLKKESSQAERKRGGSILARTKLNIEIGKGK